MMLNEKLEHFEKHQLSVGDEYGAEVLHHANKRIAQLEAENTKLREKIRKLESVAEATEALLRDVY